MPADDVDAEDGEVRDGGAEARRERAGSEERERKKSRSERGRDRSRSHSRGRAEREREREKKTSYEGVNYAALDAVDRAGDRYGDRYGADAERGKGDRDRKDRDRDRDKHRDRDKDRERKRDRHDRDRDELRRRDHSPPREELRRRDDRDDRGRGRDDRDRHRDRRDEDRERDRDRDRDRRDRKDGDRDRDRHRRDDRNGDRDKKQEKGAGGGENGSKQGAMQAMEEDDDEPLVFEEDEEEKLRKKREAIMAKFKNKGATSSPAVPTPPTSDAGPAAKSALEEQAEKPDAPMQDAAPPAPDAPAAAAGAPEPKEAGAADKNENGEGGDDMFTDSPVRPVTEYKGGAGNVGVGGERGDDGTGEVNRVDYEAGFTNADNWDDAEGYFRTRPGELIISRYLVNRDIGAGVYSTVVSATDQKNAGQEVAIKIVRSNETMHTAGRKEIDVLTRLGREDPEGKKHICKLLSHFEYKGHLCMVFQPLEMNLRKLLKTYGREVGITLTAIRMYARQMFHGLLHMQKCSVLHGDIKLDNILISKDLKNVAICDFGTADWAHEATITPYMVSRYYRPPEICLGLKYSFAMDLWSVGVCLFELYTGKFMFTGRNNNEMLKQFMDYKGMPSKKLLKKCTFFDQHFEEEKADVIFKYLTKDVCTKQEIIQKMRFDKPNKNIYESILKHKADGDDIKKLKHFADLLEKIFILDPAKRLTVSEALKHEFIRDLPPA